MDLNSWISATHERIQLAIYESYLNGGLGGWQENTISTAVLKAIGGSGAVSWSDCAQKVRWEAFKLNGVAETEFGDIALLVKVCLSPTDWVDGVAFYEAKRQYFNPAWKPLGFQSLDSHQLSRIGIATHAGHALLYDANPEQEIISATAVPNALARPLVDIIGKGKAAGERLSKFGRPWAIVLANNLRGFELDFDPAVVSAMKQWMASNQPPAFIINAAVSSAPLTLRLDSFPSKLRGFSRVPDDRVPPPPGGSTPPFRP